MIIPHQWKLISLLLKMIRKQEEQMEFQSTKLLQLLEKGYYMNKCHKK